MYIVPTIEDFEQDIYTITVAEGYSIELNLVDESFETDGRVIVIRIIQIEAKYMDGDIAVSIRCPSIIGMENSLISIVTDDVTILGQPVSIENVGKWGIDIRE